MAEAKEAGSTALAVVLVDVKAAWKGSLAGTLAHSFIDLFLSESEEATEAHHHRDQALGGCPAVSVVFGEAVQEFEEAI